MGDGINMGLLVAMIESATGADPAVIKAAVEDYLDKHPEATTTVQDGSITLAKLASDVAAKINEVTDLKSAIALVDNASMPSGWTVGAYYRLSGSFTSVDIDNPYTAGGAAYNCIAMPCKEGDVFYLTAHGSSSARPYAFLSSASGENNIIARASSAEYDLTNAKLITPKNSAYAIFNANNTYPIYLLKVEANETMLLTDVNIPFEIGNITFANPPVYKYDRESRARTPDGYTIALHKGDVIGMTDYTNAQFYAGWYNAQGEFSWIPAKSSDYTITEDGNYVFLLRNATEVSLFGNMTALTNRFFVRINTDANQIYTESVKTSKREINEENSGMNYHLFNHASPKMAMHRGYSTLAPENTLPAFTLAGQNHAWGIETDVHETTDGYFVCIHDGDVSRTTDGTGNVAEMTLAQVEALTIDAGAHIEDYENLKIPRLEEYLAICRRYGCACVIEIKTITNFANLIEIIKKAGMENSTIIITGLYTNVPIYRTYTKIPIFLVGYSNASSLTNLVYTVYSYQNTGVDFAESTITSTDAIELAHGNNMPVIAWTVDTAERADELFKMGVDVITTNSIPVLDSE